MKKLFGPKAALVCAAGALATIVTAIAPPEADAQSSSRSGGARGQSAAQQQAAQRAQRNAAAPQLDRARGASEAPAVIQAAGLTCTPADAAFVGTVQGGTSVYEVACREGLGFILTSAPAGARPRVIDCINQNAQAGVTPGVRACSLPANAQPARGLQPTVTTAGLTCTVNNARYLGENVSAGIARYEIACAEGGGYVVDHPRNATGRASATSCFRASAGGQFQCQFTTKAQALAPITAAVAQSRRQCTVSDARLVGQNPTTRNDVIEVGCAGGQPGFFIETAATGGFVQAYDCGRFGNTPCQFTAAAMVVQRNAQDYTNLLRTAGFDCTVTQFNRRGSEAGTGREIVEVACSNRPDGAFALLAGGSGGRSEVYDCLLAPKRREQCTLTKPEALYPKVSAAIAAAQRGSACTVTNHRRMGTTPQGEDWYEFACSQGRNAVVDYRGNGRIATVVRCPNATQILGGCQLPVAARR